MQYIRILLLQFISIFEIFEQKLDIKLFDFENSSNVVAFPYDSAA